MGTGLRPNRLPGDWEKTTLEMTKMSPQGPEVGKLATGTSRSMPQGEIPADILGQIESVPNGFIPQLIAGRPGMQREQVRPGDDSNKAGPTGFPAAGLGGGGGMTSKPGVMGGTLGKGTF